MDSRLRGNDENVVARMSEATSGVKTLAAAVLRRGNWYTALMVKTLEQAIAEVERLPAEDQEQIGRTLLSHVERLRALRAEIDKGIRSLDAGQGRESSL
jgi:hypothetical protein